MLAALIDSGFVEPGTEASIARAMGQSLSRLADWQTDMLADGAGRRGHATADGRRRALDRAAAAADARAAGLRLAPAPGGQRRPAVPRRPGAVDRRELAVGFADLVGYTSRSRGMGGRELGAMVEDFEGTGRRRHRPAPRPGGQDRRRRRALHLRRRRSTRSRSGCGCPRSGTADDRPPLRVGAAYGAVLTRLGDVYSPVVNLASRLTSIARPATVLVDQQLARQLRGLPELPGAAAAPGVGARLRPPPAVAGPPPARPATPRPGWPRSRSCSTRSPTTCSTTSRTSTAWDDRTGRAGLTTGTRSTEPARRRRRSAPWSGVRHPARPWSGRRSRRPGPVHRPRPRRRPRRRRRPGRGERRREVHPAAAPSPARSRPRPGRSSLSPPTATRGLPPAGGTSGGRGRRCWTRSPGAPGSPRPRRPWTPRTRR